MTKAIPLSTSLGEVLAPQILMTVLILSPDGTIKVDPGAIHGRSEIEQSVRFVQKRDQVPSAQCYWLAWVAVELDPSQRPLRYKGIAVSELWIDSSAGLGYKSLAEAVNRMDEAMRGGINLKTLGAQHKALIAQQLASIGSDVWERTAATLKEALAK